MRVCGRPQKDARRIIAHPFRADPWRRCYNRVTSAGDPMNASRAAVMVVGIILVAVWAAAAAGGRAAQPPGPPDPRAAQDHAVVRAQSALVEATDRLRRYTGPSTDDAVVRRVPFRFGGGASSPRRAPAAAGRQMPEGAPPPPAAGPPAPEIVLQGMAESREGEATVRTAILSVNGEMVFATLGATVDGRFTVVGITGDSVDLEAMGGGARQTVRLR